ncbi:MAG: hypothetical protein ACYDER_06245 [Ktedonobacteraceae bacterium]
MRSVDTMVARSVLLLILCGMNFGFLLGGYGVLRVLHISVNWVTWIIGSGIIALSMGVCLAILLPGMTPVNFGPGGNLVGVFSFLVAVYAASQWVTRQWFVKIKRHAEKWLVQASKQVLMFLRKQHLFFGWIVVAGAVGHMVFFFPILSRINIYEEITGFVAIGILALMVILGAWLWIQTAWRKRRMPKTVHTLHASLTIAFFLTLFLHI